MDTRIAAGLPGRALRRTVYWAVSLSLAAALLNYSLHGVNWRQVWITVRSARLLLVILSFALVTAALLLWERQATGRRAAPPERTDAR